MTIASAVSVQFITKKFVAAFEDYTPKTPLQARRANEQIKLSASLSNSIATAVVAILVISQSISKVPPENSQLIAGVIIAGMIHVGGRNLVGLLKPERMDDTACMTK